MMSTMRLTVNRNLTVHAANKWGTLCGCEQMSGRLKKVSYRRLEDTAEVTCQRCIAILAARSQRTGAVAETPATPATPARGD